MKENDIKVSVYCLAYNHEKYIRDALEGFVNQKTNFKYEVIVHDDASTDNTADIIREYAEKYPDIIKPIYQKENQHSKKVKIIKKYILPKMSGKYVAVCEGDDYWTDENKLQLQYDAMEQHPECSMCAHYVKVEKMNANNRVGYNPEVPSRKRQLKEGVIDSATWLTISITDLVHLSSVFMRAEYFIEYRSRDIEYVKEFPVGDTALSLYMLTRGSLYFIDRNMSTYRKGVEGSWTQRIQNDPEKYHVHRQRYLNALKLYRDYLDGRFDAEITFAIKRYEFATYRIEKNYRAMVKKEYRELFDKMSTKKKIKVYLRCVFPWLDDLKQKLKPKT